MSAQPLLEIGGTHVTAALVDPANWTVLEEARFGIDAAASADRLLDDFAAAARTVGAGTTLRWGIAIPGPFDYAHGVGDFTGVDKFGALKGVDIADGLRRRLEGVAAEFVFVNDADAFAMGEWVTLDSHVQRAVFLTLGTGVGSSFLSTGTPVADAPGLPPGGSVHLLHWQGRPIEETVSRRAITRAYTERTGRVLDVHEIAGEAKRGDGVARTIFYRSLYALGACIAPAVEAFDPQVVVVGGSIANSWDLVHGPLLEGLTEASPTAGARVRVRRARSTDVAPLIGTARAAGLLKQATAPRQNPDGVRSTGQ
ncbi:ROK family protein [Glycomyces arizonensis]|uniref:ROK family protein n=1 Tax=Glycomyces arizonensis TaxID=256035 RepID=UPI0003FEBCC4|nr:ROK family protein [Glycomyces arizonensis]